MAPLAPLAPMAPHADAHAAERHAARVERHVRRIERRAERAAARAERHAARVERHHQRIARDVEREIDREIERELAREVERAARLERLVVQTRSAAPVALVSSPGATWLQTIRSVPREVVLAMLWFWGVGALAVALFWAMAYAAAARAVRLGAPETDEDRLATWERVRLLSGVARPVRLLRSPALDVPVAWGWGDAAVVLPASADDWDDDRLEAVLLHELAHLARGDAFSQGVAQVALVLHWANPLAWLAYRHFLVEREHACDDVVLEHGARPSAYADHLVQVARDLRRRSAALAAFAPMARRSHLEGRVLSILDPARKRSALGRLAGAGLAVLLVAVVLPLTAVRPVAASAPEAPTLRAPASEAALVVAQAPAAPLPDLDTPLDLGLVVADEAAVLAAPAPPRAAGPGAGPAVALDTIPDFDEIIRPALEAALEAVRAMRTSERHDALGLSDDDWDDMEANIAAAIEDARENYDEAIQEAIEEALDGLDEGDWGPAEWDGAEGDDNVRGQAALRAQKQALARARRDLERAQAKAERAAEAARRDLRRQLRDVERRAEQDAREAAEAARQAERAGVRAHARGAARAEAQAAVRAHVPKGYAYSASDDGVLISGSTDDGVAVWTSNLDTLDRGLDGVEAAIVRLDPSDGHRSGVESSIRGSLAGIQGGLAGVRGSAAAWAQSDTERRIVRERVSQTQDRLQDLLDRLDDCGR